MANPRNSNYAYNNEINLVISVPLDTWCIDYRIYCSDENLIITLPRSNGQIPTTLRLQKMDNTAFTATIVPYSGETINGNLSYVLSQQYQYIIIFCDGTLNTTVNGGTTSITPALGDNSTNIATTAFVAQTTINGGTF